MAQEPEIIRQNIDETRSELTRKIEVLEQEVVGSVKGTTAAVAETVENVKGTVEDTVESVKDSIESTIASVKETFDLRLQTQRHPWVMVGGSMFAGYLVGSLLPSTRTIVRSATSLSSSSSAEPSYPQPSYQQAVSSRPAVERESQKPSMLAGLLDHFRPEIEQIKGVAIGTAAAVLRDMLKDKVPEGLQSHVKEMIQNVTHKLGGKDVEGPILSESEEQESNFARHSEYSKSH